MDMHTYMYVYMVHIVDIPGTRPFDNEKFHYVQLICIIEIYI